MAEAFDGALAELEMSERELELERQQKAQERELSHQIEAWHKRIRWAREHDEHYFKRWAQDRKVARGEFGELEVSANLIAAVMEVIASYLYARNPRHVTRPSDSVNRARMSDYKMFAKTLEIIVARLLKNAGLKRKAKRWIRGAWTVGLGWLKVSMQTRTEKDPLMESQLNDLHEQLQNLKIKKRDLQDPEADIEKTKAEIQDNIKAIEAKLEVVIAEGLVIDYMNPEDVTVAPDCGEVEAYLDAPWICFDSYYTREKTLRVTGWSTDAELDYLKGANRYMRRIRKGEPNEDGAGYVMLTMESDPESETDEGFYLLREIWSLDNGVVYTMLDGCTRKWAREPYAPVTGRRWYPGFLLQFHQMDGERYSQSDVHLLKSLQAEYNETRSDYRTHRRRAIPGVLFDKTVLTEDSVSAVSRSVTQEYVGIEPIAPGVDMRTVFAPKLYNQVDPALYDTGQINREFEKVSGAQEALQQSVQVEKTATEARIQQEGFGARTGARRDELEDVLTDLSEYVAQLALQLFDQADAEQYAGENAVWMELTPEQVMHMFDFEIKAGSTGKPEASRDREAWATLLPLIEGMIQKVGAARLAGQDWAAKPWIALLVETMERLEDHADIEEFLPVPPPQQPGPEKNVEQEKLKSDIKLNEAKTVETLAGAIVQVPAVARLPIVQELFGMAPGLPPQAANEPPQPAPMVEQMGGIG